jgi:casein kinase II subunit alpha
VHEIGKQRDVEFPEDDDYFEEDEVVHGTVDRVYERLAPYNYSMQVLACTSTKAEEFDPTKVASIYWDVNLNSTHVVLPMSDTCDYEIAKEIGSGTFSTVYEGQLRNETVVLKVLRKMGNDMIKREVSVLSKLRGRSPHIVQLIGAVNQTPNATLVFQYSGSVAFDLKGYKNKYTLDEIRLYMKQLLMAINASHAAGVMHRDIKLQNIIVNEEERSLQLIDWGVSEFYHPMREYGTISGTRQFRAPELLVHYRLHDYAVDVWAAGCVMAELVADFRLIVVDLQETSLLRRQKQR